MRINKISKDKLNEYIINEFTTRQIAKIEEVDPSYVSYLSKKYGINKYWKYSKPIINTEYFSKINTPEKAYILGFCLADSTLTNEQFSCGICLKDKEILDFFSKEIGFHVRTYNKFNKKTKTYPSANIFTRQNQILKDLRMLFGGTIKKERHFPIIAKNLEPYLVLGFFDGDGCITWGVRKDRNRIWHKISFTSSYKLLCGIQNILIKVGIPSKIYPKKDCDCFVMDICDRVSILKILNYIYKDLVILNRKYEKANALRLELGELGEA